ncbi:helix-turn-helix domain-containing protein [Ornithinibacillus sp. 179-J 7C1 HS]|uniref:helix-turn-helix domain-containing protein n=1 Tax=Ornithinibacillus sp. 179-J 7C1 HS TaxID=3142384 RepID=UPI0039A1254C
MNKELNEVLINVLLLFDTDEISRKLERIRTEYKRIHETKEEIQTGFGHTFSRISFMRFEEAIKRNTNDQHENFHQYVNKLMFEKDITQSTLSKRSLINESTLNRYINGSREIPINMLFRIVLAMRLSLLETEILLRKVGKRFKEAYMDGVIMEAIEQGIYDIIKVEVVLREFTEGKESLFTKKELEEYDFKDDDLEKELV